MNRTALLVLLMSGLLAGCGANVTLDTPTIPTPLLEQIGMTVGVRMPANFEHFVHEESIYGQKEWSIDLGRSNAALFEQLFAYMFAETIILGPGDDPQAMGLDAVIEPSIDAFEFSTPEQSNTDAFAVWIRYRIRVYDRAGDLTSNWPVAAYGKSLATTMGGSAALQRAAVLAMRDAAALMIMRFDNVTRISTLASTGSAPPIAGMPAQPTDVTTSEEPVTEGQGLEGQEDE